jgi:hypothetical protein
MNKEMFENKKMSEDSFLVSLLDKRCAGTIGSGDRSFGGTLLSFDDTALIVIGKRGARTLVKRAAITSLFEVD